MRQNYLLHSTLLFLLFACFANAQKATFEFFTTADGLAGNNTALVTQDDQGFIWFVNGGKLHRYDGRNFLIYPAPPEIPDGREPLLGLSSWQDSLIFLWSEHLAYLFDPKTGIWQPVHFQKNAAKRDGFGFRQKLGQRKILMSRLKNANQEVDIWLFRNNQFEQVALPKHITLLNTYFWCDIGPNGQTYLAYQDTLYQLDRSGNILAVTPMRNICTDCYNLCFQFEADGTLILLANWRFYVLDHKKNRFVPHPANPYLQVGRNHLHRFILEKNGSIWACGRDRNLVYYDAEADKLYNFYKELKALLPNANDFKGIFQDKTGIVWINTRLGLLKVRPQPYPFDTYFTGQNQASAYFSFRGLTEDPQGILYGVYYTGIARFDPEKKEEQRLYSFSDIPNFFDLYAEGNKIWVNGKQLFDPQTGRLQDVPSQLHEKPVGDNGFFSEDKNGTLWWASQYLLYYLNRSENGLEWVQEMELPERVINKTEALHAGQFSEKLWISFKGKLLQYDPATKALHWLDPKKWGLQVSQIMVIHENPDRTLWLGTDAGLVHFNPANKAVRQFTVNDGLPNNFICGMLTEGDSCLWLSTNHGLSRFHLPSETFLNFLAEDGLSSNEFNRKSWFKARNGRMFFGGMQGVTAFMPDEIIRAYRSREKDARVLLTAFEYSDERRDTILRETRFPSRPEIHLHYWDWSYTFEYALTDYNNPKEVFYSYKMEGYKDAWSAPSKFNFTRFNSLPPGEYLFRVKARDSRGQWRPNELAVTVVVYPPWWATWWAYFIYFLLLAGLAYAIFSFLKKRLLLQNELKREHEESERLKELDHFKSRLYTNLTHEFRTPLTVILGMIRQVRDNPQKHLEEGARLIEDNSKNLLHLINQLLDLSKLENKAFQLNLQQGNIVPYLRYITESFQTYADSRHLSLRFFTTTEALVMDHDEEQIKQVLTNLISNALKFTHSGGSVAVRLTKDAGWLTIEVSDTGIGISEENLPHVFDRFYQADGSHTREGEGTGIGLAHTQELLKIMGGTIQVDSTPGKGSTFTVRLPILRNMPEAAAAAMQEPAVQTGINNSVLPRKGPPTPETTRQALPHLLIIEDNADVVVYLKSCLDDQYQIDIAYNGKIGVEKALENIPDLIISDVMMPEKDGFQVCDILKNDQRTSHIPIILLTAKADVASRIAGLRRGADVYLSKPFDKEELLVRLKMLLERHKRMVAYFSQKPLREAEAPQSEAGTAEAIRIEDAFIQKLRSIIEENYGDEQFALPQLCQKIGMSRSQLFRKMQALLETSPSDFIRSYRLNKAKTLLETTVLNVSEVAWKVGFKDPGHFSKLFQEEFGVLPSATGK